MIDHYRFYSVVWLPSVYNTVYSSLQYTVQQSFKVLFLLYCTVLYSIYTVFLYSSSSSHWRQRYLDQGKDYSTNGKRIPKKKVYTFLGVHALICFIGYNDSYIRLVSTFVPM